MSARLRRRVVTTVATVVGLAWFAAACGGGDGSASYTEPTGPAVAELDFEADNFSFGPDEATAPDGILEFTVESTEGAHDLVIAGEPGFKLDVFGSGDTDTAKIDLQPGTYTYYCSIPGHRAAGMEGTLTVGQP